MGILAEIGGRTFEVSDYQVSEDSTPTALSDTSGSVGAISLTIPKPDPYLWRDRTRSRVLATNLLRSPWPNLQTVVYDPSDYDLSMVALDSTDFDTNRDEALRVSYDGSPPNTAIVLSGDNPILIPNGEDFWISVRRRTFDNAATWMVGVRSPSSPGISWSQSVGATPSSTPSTATVRFRWDGSDSRDVRWDMPLEVYLYPRFTGPNWIDLVSVTLGVGDYDESLKEFSGFKSPYTPLGSGRHTFSFRGASNDSISDETLERPGGDASGADELLRFGSGFLLGESIRLIDTERGVTSGRILGVDDNGSTISLDCAGGLDPLVADNLFAPPAVSADPGGTVSVQDVFASFIAMSGTTASYWVDPSIADVQVKFPGWQGELWTRMKEFCAIYQYEVAYVSETIVLRPIRQRTVEQARLQVSESRAADSDGTAREVEVSYVEGMYGTFTQRQVYPALGWEYPEALPVYSADVGVWNRIEVPISGSLVYWAGVEIEYDAVADNGMPVAPYLIEHRAYVEPSDPSTVVIEVFPREPIRRLGSQVVSTDKAIPQSISFAVRRSDGSMRSSLVIRGYGVSYGTDFVTAQSGAHTRTGTDTGASLSSPFLTSREQAREVAEDAAKRFAGLNFAWGGTVVRTQREIPTIEQVTYEYVANDIAENAAGSTYADAQAYVETLPGNGSYRAARIFWVNSLEPEFDKQLFGNIAGSRVYDRETNRWYRIRSATITPTTIDVQAEDDLLTIEAIQPHIDAGEAYEDVQDEYNQYTYGQVMMMGAYHSSAPITLELGFLDENDVWTPVSQNDPLPTERV